MIFDLTDEDREALERLRIRLGLRSHAETVRRLIRDADGGAIVAAPPKPSPPLSHGRSKTVVVAPERTAQTSGVPFAGTFRRPVAQKGAKK